jgi:SAM-dependent methyltransferase
MAPSPAPRDLGQRLAAMDEDDLAAALMTWFPYEVAQREESTFPVTNAAFEALTPYDLAAIESGIETQFGVDVLAEVRSWQARSLPHYRREMLRYGCTAAPELLKARTRMTSANPPLDIHCMVRKDVYAGDLYAGDMIVSAIQRAGRSLEAGKAYLDFGCSSGSLTRNLYAYLPEAHWHGCDPVEESVLWAGEQFPDVHFIRNAQEPPTPYGAGQFAGVYAVSIWSHFSEAAALAWFAEMHRIIAPGGFLVFTAHGLRTVYHYLRKRLHSRDVLAGILRGLIRDHYAFQPVWEDRSREADFLATSDWGNAYLRLEWVVRHLAPNWTVEHYLPGINQCNQDIYVLGRR